MLSGIASVFQLTYLVSSLTIQSYICQPPQPPSITTPSATISVQAGQPVSFAGTGDYQSEIVLLDGTTPIVSLSPNQANQFSATVTFSTQGTKTMSVESRRSCGNAQGNSVTLTVTPAAQPQPEPTPQPQPTPQPSTPTSPQNIPTAKPNAPFNVEPDVAQAPPIDTTSDTQNTSKNLFLSIGNPANNSSTTDVSTLIEGSTNDPSTIIISINGVKVAQTFTASRSFSLSSPLESGENEILVQATSDQGAASVKLIVTRLDTTQQLAWHQTEEGQTTIRVAAVSLVSILIILVIIGIIIL